MATFVRASAPTGARTLPRAAYVSGDVFRDENERIFACQWICVGRAEQLAGPGSFVLAEVAGESLIVVRDKAGALHALFNVCRHRGSRLCTEPEGKLPGAIQCPYHGWTYGLDGALIAARNMQDVEDFDKAEYPLRTAALAQWNGFVFINLDERPEPLERAFAPVLERFAGWTIDHLRAAHRVDYDLRCNWKLLFENYSECYHCPLIHPALDALSPADSGRNDLVEGAFLGGYMTYRRPGASLSMSGTSSRPPLPKLAPEDRGRAYYYTIFPSMLLSLHPDFVMWHHVIPVSQERTRITCEWLFDPEQMARSDFDPSDVVEFWDLTNRQDWRACELSQLGVSSRAYAPGPYAHSEGIVAAFDRYYLKTLQLP